MASQYVKPDNTAWVASPFVGAQNLQVQGNDVLVHFGTSQPTTAYEGYPHIHLSVHDGVFRYEGFETPYFRTGNVNSTGVTTTSKVACATLVAVV